MLKVVEQINTIIGSKTHFVVLKIVLSFFFFFLGVSESRAQKIVIKTNLLYGVYASAPNLGLEMGLGKRSTLELGSGFNFWGWKGSFDDNKKLAHWLAQAEYRYWLCSKFSGHFFGVHALGTQYNIGGHKLPLLLGKESKEHRYEGWGAGAGISYGYSFYLGKRWSLEASVGVGYARLHYDKYNCVKCGNQMGTENRNYFGPTKAAISLIYIIK